MLPEDANAWPNEILQELYKQVPFSADFEPHVTMDRVDAERGFGFGHIEIRNKTEVQHGAPQDAVAAAGIKSARIPIVIKDRKLQPLDLVITDDSKVLPLTEARLRQVIFRPQAFDITGRGPGDMSMIGQLYPPYRQNFGFGGGGASMSVGMGKEGSALEEYLTEKAGETKEALSPGFIQKTVGGATQKLMGTAGTLGAPNISNRLNKFVQNTQATANRGLAKAVASSPGVGLAASGAVTGGAGNAAVQRAAKANIAGSVARTTASGSQNLPLASAARFNSPTGNVLGKNDMFVPQTHGTPGAVQPRLAKMGSALAGAGAAGAVGKEVGTSLDRAAHHTEKGKHASILTDILPTIRESDYHAFFQKLSSDRGLAAQYVANGPATGASLARLAAYEPVPVRKLAGALFKNITPTVVQLRKEAAGYTLKSASHSCWLPEEQLLDRGAAVRMLGPKVVLAADTTGSATLTAGEGAVEPETVDEDGAELVSKFGIYKVQDEQGRHLIGYIFPNLIDVDGTALPISLFTNGSQKAVQGDIAGISVGTGASLFEGHPEGTGVFYHLTNGRAEATVPMTVKATLDSPEQGGVILHAETFDGREVQVVVQPNLEKVTSEGELLLIPDTFCWLPLDKAEDTTLIGDPSGFNKEGQAARAVESVVIRFGGADSFSVDGFPVEKLASDARHFLSLDETVFLLAGLGADIDYAQKKLGEAAAWSTPVSVSVPYVLKTAGELVEESKEKAASVLGALPDLRRDLVKEAAVIPDPVAVDTVLSLGFLNSENLGAFISYMPVIDDAQMRMCELLLASRLGLRDVPASALEKAIRSTEETLEGLKILAFQRS